MNHVLCVYDEDRRISAGSAVLNGILTVPAETHGAVIFAHGSSSGRYSGRNHYLAAVLQEAGFATLLLDLLTEQEDDHGASPDDVPFSVTVVAARLEAAINWVASQPLLRRLSPGCFGDGIGAAAALIVASRRPEVIEAVVSRDGRPELAGQALPKLRVPTLLIVGGKDPVALARNRQAYDQIGGHRLLAVVPEARHRFEEPGALEHVARVAAAWFSFYLTPPFAFSSDDPALRHGAA